MTDTGSAQDPTSTLSDPPPTSTAGDDRGLRRSDEGRMLTGVCAGLGRHVGIDPVLFRVGFAVLVLGSGIGIMLYIAAFLLMRETSGAPGYMEQWTRRDFDSETVLALLTAVFALGLIINVSSGGIGTGTVVVGTTFAIALLTAHARGVDLLAVARSLPDRLRHRRAPSAPYVAFTPVPDPDLHPDPGRSPLTEPYPTTAHPDAHADTHASAHTGTHGSAHTDGTSTAQAHPAAAPTEARAASETSPASTGQWDEQEPTASGSPAPRPGPGGPYGVPSSPYRPRPAYDSSGEPFSPYGPYQPLDPRKRYQQYSPYDLAEHGAPVRTAPQPKRPRSFIGSLTLCLAMIVGGIIVAIQSASGSINMTVAGGAMLIVIGGGLLVATWYGRGAGLVALGTVISIALIAGSTLTDMPKRFGSYNWEPATLSEVVRNYSVGVGDGTLDLSELALPPGSRTVFDASVSVGEINVIVPATARVEVNGSTKLGDVKIDHAVEGGADIRHNKILEPEVTPKGDVATIILNVKAGIGDVEVRRAA
ncbi:PspC domain-containing protein [Streptosporangium lutulentum]|uniref:Phage shock protein PspC (Stress-responsive transcriptional regulator) n=1 Tax=Streptosporangium lutulentum TaxID=1461250 RepID=A0ABT9QIZ5_9ACTN|nr:PspC domain-containing protein [Streptosporangium lutulentum]MDP9846659.1 phage shock protein PspC (stress-responsive transcriptional regulator) [Streptosporangium lutulentum]